MKYLFAFTLLVLVPMQAGAVTLAEDVATTIMLRGHECGGTAVTQVKETSDGAGNRTIHATCPNGHRFQIDITSSGRVTVKQLK